MKLSQITTAALLTISMAGTAMAGGVNYHALNSLRASVSFGSMSQYDESTTSINYEFGFDKYFEKYMVGANYTLEMPTDAAYLNHGSFEADLGYRVTPRALLYGLVSYDFDDSAIYDGIGFGVGAKYQLMSNIAAVAKVKYVPMSGILDNSYDKTVASIGFEFNFRTAEGGDRW